jgi:DNA mismatch repair protein MutS
MSFITDKQTLDDLNLLGKYKPHSVYGLFNKVHTTGGERLLESMFHHPLTDEEEINRRSNVFQYFEHKGLTFPFNREQLGVTEDYLGGGGESNILSAITGVLRKKILGDLVRDEAYGILHTGLLMIIEVLNTLMDFLSKLEEQGMASHHLEAENPCREQIRLLTDILGDRRLAWLRGERGVKRLSLRKVAAYDHLFRHVLREEMERVIQGIYQLDVHITVSRVSKERGFTYARALPRENQVLSAAALSHPGIDKAVANPVSLHGDSNMLFLTGANMAGKSTFMKSFGIAVYMAHMGFPVAAKEMIFSVRDGIYSSINVPDNLSQGYSHFYAEVLRVKEAASAVAAGKNLVVIFDELFKGTNVKDAYDATLAVTAAFAEYRNCFFIVSTHIIEVGEALREGYNNLQFMFLPTVMEGMIPRYTYKLEEGITTDRHGMLIIENEGILELL